MATILSAYDRGVLYGRCDASCYDGNGDKPCACVCRGSNHGLGLDAALANTAMHSLQWRFADQQERHSRQIVFDMPLLRQKALF